MFSFRRMKLSLIILAFLLFYPFVAYAIEYGGIGGRPAYPREGEPKTESIFLHEITPGEQIEEGIQIINNSAETKTLMVYSADSTPSTDGGYACEQYSEEKDAVGEWIVLSKERVTLKSMSTELIPFVINIPEDVEVGEYNGCILIQESKEDVENRAGINLSMRTGLRVSLTLPGEIVKKLSLQDFTVTKQSNGNFILHPEVKNEGNVSLDTEVKVITKNLFGKVSAEHGGIYNILRDDTSKWNFEFTPSMWGGRYSSQVFVKYNDGLEDIELESEVIEYYSMPTQRAILFITLAILPVILITVIFVVRGYIIKKEVKKWIEYTVQEGDNIDKLAKRHTVSWKRIVKVNRLKSPYVLQTNQTLKLPPRKKS